MVGYRRNKPVNPDTVFFLTICTNERKPIFTGPEDHVLLLNVMRRLRDRFNLQFNAWVILPNHLHWLIEPREADYSKVVFAFKRAVGAEYKKIGRLNTGGRLWQDRFWEHTVRDEADFERCADYIHYNPVKHRLVKATRYWKYSSFHKYVQLDIYEDDWADGGQIIIAGSEYDL
jgi:putative transposase